MKRTTVILLALLTLGLAGCGDDKGVVATTVPPTSPPAETRTDPTALGDRIGDVYLTAFADVVALLDDRPPADAAAAQLTDLKDQYVEELVALGYQREALDASGRATVDARITAALGSVPPATYEAYQAAYTDYGADREVADLIASFNVIGQYANFDLLWQQEPEEAERLGIPRR